MSDQEEVFSGNRSKIVYDGKMYRGYMLDKELFAISSRGDAIERLRSEISDATDELTDDYNDLGELDDESDGDDE